MSGMPGSAEESRSREIMKAGMGPLSVIPAHAIDCRNQGVSRHIRVISSEDKNVGEYNGGNYEKA